MIFYCFVFNFSIVQVLFRLVTFLTISAIQCPAQGKYDVFLFVFPDRSLEPLDNVSFLSQTLYFYPDFSDSPIFRTNLRIHWRFEKSGFHVTAIVSHVPLNQQQIDLRYNFTVNLTGNMVKYDSSPIYLRKFFST